MNKCDFLNALGRQLSNMPEEDRTEILYDYEEHFRMGIGEGKTEEDIAKSLGDPRSIARQYRADSAIKKAETHTSTGNIVKAVFSIGILGFFNLVFVLGPFIGVIGVVIGLFAAGFGITISGIAVFIMSILYLLFPSIDLGMSVISAIPLSVGVTALGLLFLIGVIYIGNFFYKVTIKYLKWNLGFVRK